MIIVGILVGISGYFFKEIFGIGYEAINKILANTLTWQVVLILLGLKFILVPMILYSGGFGGIFAPSLFMGACFGYLFAFFVNTFWGVNVNPTIMILVGMGAVLGGVNTIPISAILIIFEMTQNYSFILPLMLAVIISTMLVQIALRGSVQSKHLEAEGFKVTERETNLLSTILLKDIELDKIDLIPDQTQLPELMAKLIESPNSSFYTVDNEGKLSGIITEAEMRPIITEYEMLKEVLVARDIVNSQITVVHTKDDLDYVLNLFGKYNLDQFPVVDSENRDKILGSVTRRKVLSIYNHENLKRNLASGLSKELKTLDRTELFKVTAGYSIIEHNVPAQFAGKNLAELKLRNSFGLEVLMIKHMPDIFSEKSEPEIVTPDPGYKLKHSDRLVLFGSDEKLENFRRLFR